MRWRRLEVKWLWTGHLYPRRAPASRMEDPMPIIDVQVRPYERNHPLAFGPHYPYNDIWDPILKLIGAFGIDRRMWNRTRTSGKATKRNS